jgi:xylan 1,4-beta-xylosidase
MREMFRAAAEKLILVAICLLPLRAQEGPPAEGNGSATVHVEVHAGKALGPYVPIWNYFGADEPNFLYAPNGRKLLAELAELSSVPVHFRAHNLLTTGDGSPGLKWGSTNVYNELPNGSPLYNFAITDRIFDALTAAGVIPLVEIGFMPEALSKHPEPYRHTFPAGDIFTGWSYPPKDEAAWKKWSNLVVAYTTHLRHRYGSQTSSWLWEVWNEPDIDYWHGTPAEYDRLYDLTAAAIRQVLPEAKIGGPEATGLSDHSEPFLRQFLEHCAHGTNAATGGTGAPLDFISYHPKGHPALVDGHIVMSMGTQLRAVERGMKVIASYPEWRNTPIILGESDPEGCGACLRPQNGYRNKPLYGASVTEATMRTYELSRRYGLTVDGSVTWAFEFEDQPLFAPLRALATAGIDKPVLNAFRLMGMLAGGPDGQRTPGSWIETESSGALPLSQVIEESVTHGPDVNAVAARNGRNVNVLVWDYDDSDQEGPPAHVQLVVDGVKGDEVFTSEFRMDETHSNSYRVWQHMGSPSQLTAEQRRALEQAGKLEQTQRHRRVALELGTARIEFDVPRQGIVLIRMTE